MKTAIVYYSYSGNTHNVAQAIVEHLTQKGEEAIPVRIRPLQEETSFALQSRDAFFGKKPELYRTLLDLSEYDRIILGSPVWAFRPAPAINTYLSTCSSLEGKEVYCFVTYGSGTGKGRAMRFMQQGLVAKGARWQGEFFIQQAASDERIKEIIAAGLS